MLTAYIIGYMNLFTYFLPAVSRPFSYLTYMNSVQPFNIIGVA